MLRSYSLTSRRQPTKLPNTKIWPLSAPFDYGTLNVSLSSKVGIMAMKRVIKYCMTKGSAGYPKLSYMIWRHIACSTLNLSEKIAWLYFDTYWLLSETSPKQRQSYEQQLARVANDENRSERLKDNRKVDCLSFIVLIYLQQYNIVARRSLIYSREDWPSLIHHRSSSQSSLASMAVSESTKSHSLRKSLVTPLCNEDTHLNFITNHLEELICLLASEHRKDLSDSPVPLDCVKALDFVLEGSHDSGKTALPLHEILIMRSDDSGYNQRTKSFDFKRLVQFIKLHLCINPFASGNCINCGIVLISPVSSHSSNISISTTSNADSISSRQRKRLNATISSNSGFAPENRKLVIVSSLYKQTVIETSNHYQHAEVKIYKCSSSFIYILSPLKCVSIIECGDTTIVLPSVETTVLVEQCEEVNFVVACRRFAIGTSSDCKVNLLSAYSPIVLSSNQSIMFGPFNTNFVGLEQLINMAGLVFTENRWNQPIIPSIASSRSFVNDRAGGTGVADVFELANPNDFSLMNVPVKCGVALKSPLPDTYFPLPPEYQRQVDSRKAYVDEWKQITKKASLTVEQKAKFQSFVEKQFHFWLKASGAKRELDQLLAAVAGDTSSSSSANSHSASLKATKKSSNTI